MKLLALFFALAVPLATPNAMQPHTVFISARTDGHAGTGTKADPFNGSTRERFDAVIYAQPPGTVIYLAAGSYQTWGDETLVQPGCRIIGAGMASTCVQLVPHSSLLSKHRVFAGVGDGLVVACLTADANYSLNLYWDPHQAVGGITLAGNDCTLESVHVIHAYGDTAKASEEFSLAMEAIVAGQRNRGCKILNCYADHYAPGADNTNGFQMAGCADSRIEDCHDDGATRGFNTGNTFNVTIAGCTTTLNTGVGVYTDTGSTTNLTIEGCQPLAAASLPIQFNAPLEAKNVTITGNELRSPGPCAIALNGSGGGSMFNIQGNTYTHLGGALSGFIQDNAQAFVGLELSDNSANTGLAAPGDTVAELQTCITFDSNNHFGDQ